MTSPEFSSVDNRTYPSASQEGEDQDIIDSSLSILETIHTGLFQLHVSLAVRVSLDADPALRDQLQQRRAAVFDAREAVTTALEKLEKAKDSF